MSESRALTPDERDRLQPLIEETEIAVRVSPDRMTLTDDENLPLAGRAIGHWPFERRVILCEQCFEDYTDLQLLGLLAHELGHHDGRHILLTRVGKWSIAGLGACLLVGLIALGIVSGIRFEWGVFAGCIAGITLVVLSVLLGTPGVKRRLELAADRRGAAIVGSTAPLEALCLPAEETPRADLWTELIYPAPHPADRLAALRE